MSNETAPGPLCMCKDRALSECPGEWGPGCDLGNNPAYVRASNEAKPALPEPIAFIREWEGDDSDLGSMLCVSSRDECDDSKWYEVYTAEQMHAFRAEGIATERAAREAAESDNAKLVAAAEDGIRDIARDLKEAAQRAEALRKALADIASRKRPDPCRGESNAGRWATLTLPVELLAGIDALLAAGSERLSEAALQEVAEARPAK